MTPRRRLPAAASLLCLALALWAPGATAQSAGVYRCGNSYTDAPCPGGRPIDAADPRSEAQRQQARAARQQELQLARQLAAERSARERAQPPSGAAGFGPTASERKKTELAQARQDTRHSARDGKPIKAKKPKLTRPARLPVNA